jgi:hypothetical protein
MDAAPVEPSTTPPTAPAGTPLTNHDELPEVGDQGMPTFDWRRVVPEGTPMHIYMSTVCTDDSPEEYHVANFLMLIGLMMGKDVYLEDEQPVFGNVFTCLVGDTGVGKSKPDRYIRKLIRRIAPFEPEVWNTNGVRMIRNPGSGQYLTSLFRHETDDDESEPETNSAGKKSKKKIRTNPSVRAWVSWPEMSGMLTKGDREGKTQPTLIDLYDGSEEIGGGSLTHKEYSAENAFGSVSTTVQTAVLKSIVRPDDVINGFLNRFWFILGNKKEKHPMGRSIDILATCADPVLALRKWAESRREDNHVNGLHHVVDVTVEDASGAEHVRFLKEEVYAIQERDTTSGLLARLDLHFKKLVLLFSANMMEQIVSVSAVKQAEAYFHYLVRCYERISSQLVLSETSEIEQAIIDTYSRRADTGVEEWFAIREIYRHSNKVRSMCPSMTAMSDIVRGLVRAGVMEEAKKPATGDGGRPTLKYRVME